MESADAFNPRQYRNQGLDDIISGGLPRNRTYLIQGQPGSGKTTLALQFLLEGLRAGEKSLYVTLSESREEIEAVADSHGWSLKSLDIIELSSIEDFMGAQMVTTMLHPAEVDPRRTIDRVMVEIDRLRPHRIIFDSLAELRLLAQDPLRYRRQLLALKQERSRRRATVLLLDDRASHGDDLQVQSIVHGVIALERMASAYGTVRRRAVVDKLRGVGYRTGYHDYVIERGGCLIFPRLIAAEFCSQISSGAQRMSKLITSIKDYSLASRRTADVEVIPLAQPLAEVLANLEQVIGERDATITCGPLPTVPGDATAACGGLPEPDLQRDQVHPGQARAAHRHQRNRQLSGGSRSLTMSRASRRATSCAFLRYSPASKPSGCRDRASAWRPASG